MNLPNEITFTRVFVVPIFLLFIIPLPDWILQSSVLSFMNEQLIAYNNFIVNYGRYIAAAIFIVASCTDGIDGYIARKRNLVTNLGKFLDPIADKLLTTAALIALVQLGDVWGWAAMIIIGRELLVTGLRLVAAGDGIVIAASKLGKIKQVSQVVAISAGLLKNFPLSLFTSFRLDRFTMFIAVIFTIYSGYDYIAKNLHVLKSED